MPMLRYTLRALLKVETPPVARGVVHGAQRRRQFRSGGPSSKGSQYTFTSSTPVVTAAAGGDAKRFEGASQSGRVFGHLARPIRSGEQSTPSFSSFPNVSHTNSTSPQASQRQRYREEKARAALRHERECQEVAASCLSPLPSKYGLYNGIDADGFDAVRPTPEMRRLLLQHSLESRAVSAVEFTEGGEGDVDRNGLPESEYHGQEGWTAIPQDSAIYSNVFAKGELDSRRRTNTWGVARRQAPQPPTLGDAMGEYAPAQPNAEGGNEGAAASSEVLDDIRRRRHQDDGRYSPLLEGELLEPMRDSVGSPRSTYALRKMFVKGLVGYQGMISRAEEAQIAEELLYLLQDPKAAYIAEETRYCVNLYEEELGIPGKDTLAFSLARAPTLHRVLYRFFCLGLIPSPPNVCQVSEMIGNFSGYPVHRKPSFIGSYCGILNLVSTTVMHMQHRDCPWYPRLHINPRTLFVVTEPCLSEYAMGYKQTHQPFHAFEYSTRVSKDYRLEVMFATVEAAHSKHLNEAVQLTAYAREKRQKQPRDGLRLLSPPGEVQSDITSTSLIGSGAQMDVWLQKVRDQLHDSEKGEGCGSAAAVVDGNALREQLIAQHLVGAKSVAFEKSTQRGELERTPTENKRLQSAAQRRLTALKARHDYAQGLNGGTSVQRSSDGPRLIRGHAPGDRSSQ